MVRWQLPDELGTGFLVCKLRLFTVSGAQLGVAQRVEEQPSLDRRHDDTRVPVAKMLQ